MRKLCQRVIEGGQFDPVVNFLLFVRPFQPHLDLAAAALHAESRAGVIHKDVPDDAGGQSKEMASVTGVRSRGTDKPEERLIDDRGCLQGVPRSFAGEERLRNCPQFVVHQTP